MMGSVSKTSSVDRWLTITGVMLVLFMTVHLLFVSTILLGKDVMYHVTQFFRLSFIFEEGHPVFISIDVLLVTTVVLFHIIVGMKKFLVDYKRYKLVNHVDIEIDPPAWFLQFFTGVLMMGALSIHLYTMFVNPSNIGPFASAHRIVDGYMWVVYLILLICVEIHASIGMYRIVIKWRWMERLHIKAHESDIRAFRKRIGAYFLILGFLTLAVYMKIGFEHWGNTGDRYVPSTHLRQ